MSQHKVRFVKFKKRDDEDDWFKVFVTMPEKNLNDHYFTIVPQQYVDAINEIFTLLDFEITIEEET